MEMNKVEEVTSDLQQSSLQDQEVETKLMAEEEEKGFGNHSGVCAICLDKIKLQEIALVKGCEHAYCVTCILHWATYSKTPNCPQCKHPFDFLNVHRSLDGCIHDYMFEESVCLLLRAQWFTALSVTEDINSYGETEDYCPYEEEYGDEDDDGDLDEAYFNSSTSIRIGNRRWGDNGFVRAGRQQARPVARSLAFMEDFGAGASSSQQKEVTPKDKTGRRAKRALKREAADKAAAEKHEQRLIRLGRK